MDIEQMIKKWDGQIALHIRVCDDPLMYTKEERLKNSHYAQAICAVLADLKQVENISSNTVHSDRLPNAEDVKRWYQLLVGKSEEVKQKDIEATLR